MHRSLIASLAGAALLALAGAAQSAVVVYTANMTGANEVPPTGSTANGFSRLTIDDALNTMLVDVTFSGLSAPAAAAHIHCCTPIGTNIGVAVPFPGFPADIAGAYSHFFNLTDASIYTSSFLTDFGGGTATGAETALLTGLASHMAYTNIHNSLFPGGEIRGNPTAVPEPEAWVLMLLGLGLIGATLRRRGAVCA